MRQFTFEVIGHRGCEGLAPENSLAAMCKAIELGIDRVEFDIMQTKEGSLVVIHDREVRVGIHRVPVSRLNRMEIARAKGIPLDEIPLLDEVLNVCKGRIKIQAELKVDGIESSVLAVIGAINFPLADINISSFSLDRLSRVRGLAPLFEPYQLVYLLDKGKDIIDATDDIQKIRLGTMSIHASRVTRELVTILHDGGIRVIAWGIGEMGKPRHEINTAYQSLLDKGVDGFTCAYPDVLKEMVRAAGSTARTKY